MTCYRLFPRLGALLVQLLLVSARRAELWELHVLLLPAPAPQPVYGFGVERGHSAAVLRIKNFSPLVTAVWQSTVSPRHPAQGNHQLYESACQSSRLSSASVHAAQPVLTPLVPQPAHPPAAAQAGESRSHHPVVPTHLL